MSLEVLETSKLTWDASQDLGLYLQVLEKSRWGAGLAWDHGHQELWAEELQHQRGK